jgi:hypothetical protein
MPRATPKVLKVTGPIILDWGNGVQLQISPVGAPIEKAASAPAKPPGRPGRKPSPSTLALIQAMEADKAAGTPKSTQDYMAILRERDPGKSDMAARQIVMREAKRIFGQTLGRGKSSAEGRPGRSRGRQPNPITVLLREKLAEDKSSGGLRDASHYVKWAVDQPGVKLGLKGVRPIVYREFRRLGGA